MSLVEKNDPVNKIEICGPFKFVQVRSAHWVEKDGEMVGDVSYKRVSFYPGKKSDIPEVQAVLDAVHTPSVIAAYQAMKEESGT